MGFRRNKKCRSRVIPKKSSGIVFQSIGIISEPMLKHMPIHRATHISHLLLGLGNDPFSKHKEYAQKRIEKVFSDEMTAQNVSLLAQIKSDDTMIAHDYLKK